MVGAFLGLIVATTVSQNFIIVMVIAMIGAAILGMAVEKVAYKPVRGSARISALISAIGASIVISNLVMMINGPQRESYPALISAKWSQVIIIITAILLMVGLHYVVNKTKMGTAMRAVSMNLDASRLMGINPNKIISFTFAIGSALAAAAGVLYGTYYHTCDPFMGLLFGLKAFVAAVLGGIGSIPGAMVGGMILGISEISAVALGFSSMRDAIAFTILIVILIVKPAGLFGKATKEKV
jgi:branched-chain amino acid transport system permease protein